LTLLLLPGLKKNIISIVEIDKRSFKIYDNLYIDLKRVGLLGVKIYRPTITSEITALASVVEDGKKTWNIQVCMNFILHFRILVVLKI